MNGRLDFYKAHISDCYFWDAQFNPSFKSKFKVKRMIYDKHGQDLYLLGINALVNRDKGWRPKKKLRTVFPSAKEVFCVPNYLIKNKCMSRVCSVKLHCTCKSLHLFATETCAL